MVAFSVQKAVSSDFLETAFIIFSRAIAILKVIAQPRKHFRAVCAPFSSVLTVRGIGG